MTNSAIDGKPPQSIPDESDSEICIPNISKSERRKRLGFGLVSLIFAIGILVGLIATETDRLWRLPLFFLFVGATTGYFQAREKT